jgi:hypothetical protein
MNKVLLVATGNPKWDALVGFVGSSVGNVQRVYETMGAVFYDINFPAAKAFFPGVPAAVCATVNSDGSVVQPSPAFPEIDATPAQLDYVMLAEQYIHRFFSVAKLLQLKVWWDTFPHEETPKLVDTYQWVDGVTRAALSGSQDFAPPPHKFAEIAVEITSL